MKPIITLLFRALPVVVLMNFILPPGTAWPQNDHSLQAAIAVGWDSKYITQGRDNLDHGGAFTPELSLEAGGFYGGVWAAIGDAVYYNEVNLYAGHHFAWRDFELELSYTYLYFEHEHNDDNELSAVVSYSGFGSITPEIEYLHSTDADGGILYLTLSGEWQAADMTFAPYVTTGLDYGYSTPEHDGLNHIETGVELTVPLSKNAALAFYASHSFAREDIDREEEEEGLGDETWAGLHLTHTFGD